MGPVITSARPAGTKLLYVFVSVLRFVCVCVCVFVHNYHVR